MKKTFAIIIQVLSLCLFTFLIGCGSSVIPDGGFDIKPSELKKMNASVPGDGNAAVLLGAVPVEKPADDVPPGLAVFSGRWEGYDMGQPVPGDVKLVCVVKSIGTDGGEGVIWSGYDFQSVMDLKKIKFSIIEDDGYSLHSELHVASSERTNWHTMTVGLSLRHNSATDSLEGFLNYGTSEQPLIMKRGNSFITYRDYRTYLKELGISVVHYTEPVLKADGKGMLVYLPPEYETHPDKSWPLIYFFHGSGDTGKDVTAIAKASPFMYIRSGGTLPAIIIAPALRDYSKYRSFTPEYLKAVYDKAVTMFRIDTSRVYVTGLSMGGESAYRFTLEYPELVRAAAPLCFGDPALIPGGWSHTGFKPLPQPYTRAAKIPFLIIHGTDDAVVPHMFSVDTANAMKKAGLDVTLRILEDHGHDVWTDTYSDPAFYEWLLSR